LERAGVGEWSRAFRVYERSAMTWPGDCFVRVHNMQTSVKGMVQVNSVTYRIVRVSAGQYDVVRLLDDARIGMFSLGGNTGVTLEGGASDVIREVARLALQGGRTTWTPRFVTPR
jgi:hypothetical protein